MENRLTVKPGIAEFRPEFRPEFRLVCLALETKPKTLKTFA